MIYSDEGYRLVQTQLAKLERALQSLREDVLARNVNWYRLMADPYEEQIEKLRIDLRAYENEKRKPNYLRRFPSRPTFLSSARHALAA